MTNIIAAAVKLASTWRGRWPPTLASGCVRRRRRTRCRSRDGARGLDWVGPHRAGGPGTVTIVIERSSVDMATVRRLVAEVDTTALCDAAPDIRDVSPALRCRPANPLLCRPARTRRRP